MRPGILDWVFLVDPSKIVPACVRRSPVALFSAFQVPVRMLRCIYKEFASFLISSIEVQVDHSRLGMTAMESPRGPTLRDLVLANRRSYRDR